MRKKNPQKMYFSREALEKFNEMCADGINFGEEPVYDFAKCIMPNGEVYGISKGETCKKGRALVGKGPAKKGAVASRMARLKLAFLKKTGREMTPGETKQAFKLISTTPDPKK